MKKIICMILAAVLIWTGISPAPVYAAEKTTEEWAKENGWTQVGGTYRKAMDGVNYRLFYGQNQYDSFVDASPSRQIAAEQSENVPGTVSVPGMLDGYEVKSVARDTFRANSGIQKCVLGEGIELIGESAFMNCDQLEGVKLPETLKMIDGGAFYHCPKLKTLTIPASVKYVGRTAFLRDPFQGTGMETLVFEGNAPEVIRTSEYVGYSLSGVEGVTIKVYEDSTGWEDEIWQNLQIVKVKRETDTETRPDQKPAIPESDVTKVFEDVPVGKWYVPHVQNVYDKKLMVGTGDFFHPEDIVLRAHIFTTLYRLAGEPEVEDYSACEYFGDVQKDKYYTDAVCWAYKEGIATGNPETKTMDVFNGLTRQQMAVLFFRFAQWKGADVSARAEDSLLLGHPQEQVSDYAKEAVSWCIAEHLIEGRKIVGEEGKESILLSPKDGASRAQFAKVLSNFMNLAEQ